MLAIAGLSLIGPPEKTLGTNIRSVYLHGAWVWASLVTIGLSGLAGFIGLVRDNEKYLLLSRALGRSGLILWITYLPISMWAMEANWNGLFLAEPRWRVAIVFAISGFLLQSGLSLLNRPRWDGSFNLLFSISLAIVLINTRQVMHPPSPIWTSDAWRIQIYFSILTLTMLVLAAEITWWLLSKDQQAKQNKALKGATLTE